MKKTIAIVLLVVVGGVILTFSKRSPKPAERMSIHFLGYQQGTNGFRVAQFAVTNGNPFAVECFLEGPPSSIAVNYGQSLFDPKSIFLAKNSDVKMEGAMRRFVQDPVGTNLPTKPWVLSLKVVNVPARALERVQASVWLVQHGFDRMGRFVAPRGAVSILVSEVIEPDAQP